MREREREKANTYVNRMWIFPFQKLVRINIPNQCIPLSISKYFTRIKQC